MRRNFKDLFYFFGVALWVVSAGKVSASDIKLDANSIKAGDPITIRGSISPGQDLYVVVASEKFYMPSELNGSEEKKKLKKMFGDTAIPPYYYVVANAPETLATPKETVKGQTKGVFAFPPFKFSVRANKLKSWSEISPEVKAMLGPVSDEEQWKYLVYTHEDNFGINTISKESPTGGGNARMVMTDHGKSPESWNEGVSLTLDKITGEFAVSMTPYKNIAPSTEMAVYVNGEKINTFTVEASGYFFKGASIYMNPLLVGFGTFFIGILFVVVGAAGGLFTVAFQLSALGVRGPMGVNAANMVKPTNLFLTLCSPLAGLTRFFREKRFAWPVAVFFAMGIVLGAFFLGPNFSAKYLPLKAYKFYLGIICMGIAIKLFVESLPSSIEKKKGMAAVARKFNEEVKKAKENGTKVEFGKVEFEKFNLMKFNMKFWGEPFVARPLVMLFAGIFMGMVASSFGVGGGFMFMPFMASVLHYPMYLAVPISVSAAFATSVGGITKYIMMGYQPDWVMGIAIGVGGICGGLVGPSLQKKLPEIFLKRLLAFALLIVFLKYTQALWFLR